MNIQIEWDDLNKVVADYVERKTGLECCADNVCFSIEVESVSDDGEVDGINKIMATVYNVEAE